jgi:hypothetical protein
MPGRLDVDMLAALQAHPELAYVVGVFEGPTGTLRWGKMDSGVCCRGGNFYDDVVVGWGTFEERADFRQCSTAVGNSHSVEVSERVDDRWFSAIADAGYRLEGSTLTVYVASPLVASEKWWPLFVGTLESGYENPEPLHYRLTFAAMDAPLRATIARRLTESLFPDIGPDLIDSVAPLVWGHWDSLSAAQAGCLPAIRLRASAGANVPYCASWGAMKAINRVYQDGTGLLTLGAGYTVTYPNYGGDTWTVLTIVADPAGAAITWEGDGYETVGDGSGTLITDPVDQIEHFLHNFVFNRSSGSWYTRATAPALGINTAQFDAAKAFVAKRANATGVVGGRAIREETTGLAELNAHAESFRLAYYVALEGALGIALDNPHGSDYVTSPLLLASECRRSQSESAIPIAWQRRADDPCDVATVALGDALTGMVASTDVGDSGGSAQRTQTISTSWGVPEVR